MMFIYGFLTCALIVFILYMFISAGVKFAVKDEELAIAVYKTKTDTWEITKTFDEVVNIIELRRQRRPGTVKTLK